MSEIKLHQILMSSGCLLMVVVVAIRGGILDAAAVAGFFLFFAGVFSWIAKRS